MDLLTDFSVREHHKALTETARMFGKQAHSAIVDRLDALEECQKKIAIANKVLQHTREVLQVVSTVVVDEKLRSEVDGCILRIEGIVPIQGGFFPDPQIVEALKRGQRPSNNGNIESSGFDSHILSSENVENGPSLTLTVQAADKFIQENQTASSELHHLQVIQPHPKLQPENCNMAEILNCDNFFIMTVDGTPVTFTPSNLEEVRCETSINLDTDNEIAFQKPT